jgi:hypothetical protein
MISNAISPSRSIHIVCRLGAIQLKKLNGQLGGMEGLNSCLASGQEESFDAVMPESLNRVYSVVRHYPTVKQRQRNALSFPEISGLGEGKPSSLRKDSLRLG